MPSTTPEKVRATTVITIDGPAGAGKSTIAKELAKRLHFDYLDTGAMYRALTLKALRQKINLKHEDALVNLAQKTSVDIQSDDKNNLKVYLDDEDVTDEIRSSEVTENTAFIARIPKVRKVMVERQRAIGRTRNIVVEGRDIGTVVFPDATRKFYLDADFNERAKRRIRELKNKGRKINKSLLSHQLKERDQKDLTRSVGPLKKAEDAIYIDSTHLSIEQVVDKIWETIT